MQILVTNDDGIYARGLWVLVEYLKKLGDVIVVAPDREQSGVGTAVTLHRPLRIRELIPLVEGVPTYSIEGTPADSVILALEYIAQDKIDLVVSGINEGANLGDDVLISGTVGAALQAYFRKIPAIAISVAAMEGTKFDVAGQLARQVANMLFQKRLPNPLFLNINVPNLILEEIQGIEITRLSERSYIDLITEGYDGKRKYFWIARGKLHWQLNEGTDIWAVENGRISVTPLQTNLTSTCEKPALQGLSNILLQQLHIS